MVSIRIRAGRRVDEGTAKLPALDQTPSRRPIMENVISPTHTLERFHDTPRSLAWTGRVLTGLVVAFLFVDAIGKLIPLAPYVEGTQKVGFAIELLRPLGLALAVPTLLHVIPRTQFLGAVLLTAYFGGAVAAHLHTGTSFWFPVTFGVILWTAYAMRSARFRSFLLSTIR
jgi:hypothetical protein